MGIGRRRGVMTDIELQLKEAHQHIVELNEEIRALVIRQKELLREIAELRRDRSKG